MPCFHTVPFHGHPCGNRQINPDCQPHYAKKGNQCQKSSRVGNDSLIKRVGIIKSVSLHGIPGIHSEPDMSRVRVDIIIGADIAENLLLAQNGVSHKHQTVRIIDQIPAVFGKKFRYRLIRSILQRGDVGIGMHTVLRHHTHHIFCVALIFLIRLITDLVALEIYGKTFNRRCRIALKPQIIHPVIRIADQLLLPVNRGIAAVQQRKHDLASAVLMGHLDAA
ncbi:hypothetical protein IMSAG185_01324 [Lachnospiraceae bacterium]|nr:hypothetical protein IMSAG185_01324 [Lachnospiraceae bacterium]